MVHKDGKSVFYLNYIILVGLEKNIVLWCNALVGSVNKHKN